jgi:hypothetical protein
VTVWVTTVGTDMPSSTRRFPPPWTVEEYRGVAYIVRDANRFPVAYVYFASEMGHTRYFMTKDEARTNRGQHRQAARTAAAQAAEVKRPGVPYSTGPLRFANVTISVRLLYRSATERTRVRKLEHICGWRGAPGAWRLWTGRHR